MSAVPKQTGKESIRLKNVEQSSASPYSSNDKVEQRSTEYFCMTTTLLFFTFLYFLLYFVMFSTVKRRQRTSYQEMENFREPTSERVQFEDCRCKSTSEKRTQKWYACMLIGFNLVTVHDDDLQKKSLTHGEDVFPEASSRNRRGKEVRRFSRHLISTKFLSFN